MFMLSEFTHGRTWRTVWEAFRPYSCVRFGFRVVTRGARNRRAPLRVAATPRPVTGLIHATARREHRVPVPAAARPPPGGVAPAGRATGRALPVAGPPGRDEAAPELRPRAGGRRARVAEPAGQAPAPA